MEDEIHIPPTLDNNSTTLKFCLQMGQLFARSTHGFRQSLCRLWPQGSRWATSTASVPLLSLEASLSSVSGLGTTSAASILWLSPSPRSPKHTIHVSDIVDVKDVGSAACRRGERHEEQRR